MVGFKAMAAGIAVAAGCVTFVNAETLTIATVNNDDMIIMQKLSPNGRRRPAIRSIGWSWRRTCCASASPPTSPPRAASSTSSRSAPTRRRSGARRAGSPGWTISADYDYDDLLAPVRNGLSVDGKLYAVPFYAESSFTLYRKDLFEKAGLTMPEQPT